MKAKPILLRVIAPAAGAAVLISVALLAMSASVGTPSADEVVSLRSPDGRVKASLIETNGGATTSFGYLVTVAPSNQPEVAKQVASLYGATRNPSAYGANLRWVSPKELVIEYMHAHSTTLPAPTVTVAGTEVAIVLRPNTTDPAAPSGGMLYNLHGHRQ